MAFKQVRHVSKSPQVTFTPLSYTGVLRFNAASLQFLQEHGINLTPDQPVDIFVDDETYAIGFKLSPDATLHGHIKEKALHISCSGIKRAIPYKVKYDVRFSDPSMDFVLQPVHVIPVSTPLPMKTVPPETVRRAVDLWQQRLTLEEIGEALNKDGYQTPSRKKWSTNSVYKLLQRNKLENAETHSAETHA